MGAVCTSSTRTVRPLSSTREVMYLSIITADPGAVRCTETHVFVKKLRVYADKTWQALCISIQRKHTTNELGGETCVNNFLFPQWWGFSRSGLRRRTPSPPP